MVRVTFDVFLDKSQDAALLIPIQREAGVPHEMDSGEFGWVSALENSLCDVGCEERQTEQT